MAYIMPVKFCDFTKDSISLNTAEKSCEESPEVKKDNGKEFFNNINGQYSIAFTKTSTHNTATQLLSSFCGFVETPPPDFL